MFIGHFMLASCCVQPNPYAFSRPGPRGLETRHGRAEHGVDSFTEYTHGLTDICVAYVVMRGGSRILEIDGDMHHREPEGIKHCLLQIWDVRQLAMVL
jgi:hypothetical protein